jgi:two-component system, chemotaxis family, chemotaxis protein CheY
MKKKSLKRCLNRPINRRYPMSNILICDDSKVACKLLRSPLVRAGHNVLAEVHTAQEALEKVRSMKLDLITMDLVMPIRDGIDAYAAIQTIHKESPQTKLVIVSAMNQEGIRQKVLEMGCDAFIVKPFDEEQVTAAVREALAHVKTPSTDEPTKEIDFNLTEMGKDALTEMCNVAVGNASGVLSDYLGVSVDLSVPEVSIQKADKPLVLAHVEKGPHLFFLQQLRGLRINGCLTYTLSKESALGLLSFVRKGEVVSWGESEKTEFKRLSTLLSDSFLEAFNRDMQARFTSFPVDIMEGDLDPVMKRIAAETKNIQGLKTEGDEYTVGVIVEMTVRDKKWYSYFLLALSDHATETLLYSVMENLEKRTHG